MHDARDLELLLILDLALLDGMIDAHHAASALAACWDRRQDIDPITEAARIARVPPEALDGVRQKAARMIREAGGDAALALTRYGGLDRTFHIALTGQNPALSQALSEVGGAIRAPLRELAQDRYVAFDLAGEGGMGLVYWALDTELNRAVAFKVVRPDAATGERALPPSAPAGLVTPSRGSPASEAFETLKARFLQEAWITSALEHPGIVPVYELGCTATGVPYYTMRFVRGRKTLRDAIQALTGATLQDRLALLEPFLKLCDTVAYAHSRGVIHRDLKPENVALGEFGEVVVLDWGLARLHGRPDTARSLWQERIQEFRTATDLRTVVGLLGTPGYMAPEAALGRIEEVDAKADAFSLGAILFEILTGSVPFSLGTSFAAYVDDLRRGPPPLASSVLPEVPQSLSEVCARALAPTREARLGSAHELAEEVRAWLRADALERESRASMREARSALDDAAALQGTAKLRQVDRASTALQRILEGAPEHPEALALSEACERAREAGLAEHARSRTRRSLARAFVGMLMLALIGTGVAAAWINTERKGAEQARQAEADARADAESALDAARILGLVSASEAERGDPMRALLLAHEAARHAAGKTALSGPSARTASATVSRLHAALFSSLERARFQGHTARILEVDVTGDGQRFLSVSENGEIFLWQGDGTRLASLQGHEGAVHGARFSPDGNSIATAGEDGARLWRGDGTLRTTLMHGGEGVHVVSWSPDGRKVATGTWAGAVRVWDRSGSLLHEMEAHVGSITEILWLEDPERLITRSLDGRVRVWDGSGSLLHTIGTYESPWREEGEEPRPFLDAITACARTAPDAATIFRAQRLPGGGIEAALYDQHGGKAADLEGHDAVPFHVHFSGDGSRLLTKTYAAARLWSWQGDLLATAAAGERETIGATALTEHGDRFLVSLGEQARLYDADGAVQANLVGHRDQIQRCLILSDGTLLTTSHDGTARLWEPSGSPRFVVEGLWDYVGAVPVGDRFFAVDPYTQSLRIFAARRSEIASVPGWPLAAAPHAAQFITSTGNEVQVRDVNGGLVAALPCDASVRFATYSEDGGRVLIGLDNGTALLWDGAATPAVPLHGHNDHLTAGVFHPTRDLILTVAGDRTARVWTGQGREILRLEQDARVEGDPAGIDGAAFVADGTRILTWGLYIPSTLWHLDGSQDRVLPMPDMGPRWVMVSPSTFQVCALYQEAPAQLVDVRTGDAVTLGSSREADWGALFFPDGKRILTASSDRRARIWDLEGRLLAVIAGHRGSVTCVAIAPDGQRLATGSLDGEVRVHDEQGVGYVVSPSPNAGIANVEWTHDGRHLVVGTREGRCTIWHADLVDLLDLAEERITRSFTMEERGQYGSFLSVPGRKPGR